MQITRCCFQVGTDAAPPHWSLPQNPSDATAPAADPSTELGDGLAHCSEERASSSQEREEAMDEDDLPAEQTSQSTGNVSRTPPAVLREIDQDGNEIIIHDHRTSAGFTFQNTLMFELD